MQELFYLLNLLLDRHDFQFLFLVDRSVIKVDPLNLESQNQAKNIPVGLPSSPIKIWGKSVQGFRSYERTIKQTDRQANRDYNFI